jgi:RsiW-degrading membrane proteinase PrsW (M82 family)
VQHIAGGIFAILWEMSESKEQAMSVPDPTPPPAPPNNPANPQAAPGYGAYPPGAPGYPAYPQPYPVYAPPPGTPAYPQAVPPGYPAYQQPLPGYPAAPNPYPGYAPYGYYPYLVLRPPRDTYRFTVGIVATVLVSLTLLVGLLLLLSFAGLSIVGATDDLAIASLLGLGTVLALGGGGVGLYFSIRAIMGKGSAPVRLPPYWVPLALTAAILGVGIIQHDAGLPQAPALLEVPLLLLAGIMPAVATFTFTAQRLGFPTTWRRVWLSYLSGTFLATLLALILEGIASNLLASFLQTDTGSLVTNANDTNQLIAEVLLAAVVAPIVEEGFKPVGPLVIIGRLRSPAEAFLVGMAAGIGFAILETTGYIGSYGGADWVIVAVERIGASLIHGVGAGMATMGWYYLFRGRGVPGRFAKGFGGLAYAVAQHAIFNASSYLQALPGSFGDFLNTPISLLGLPERLDIVIPFAIYVAIIFVLVRVTRDLRPTAVPPAESPAPAPPSPTVPDQLAAGGVR